MFSGDFIQDKLLQKKRTMFGTVNISHGGHRATEKSKEEKLLFVGEILTDKKGSAS